VNGRKAFSNLLIHIDKHHKKIRFFIGLSEFSMVGSPNKEGLCSPILIYWKDNEIRRGKMFSYLELKIKKKIVGF